MRTHHRDRFMFRFCSYQKNFRGPEPHAMVDYLHFPCSVGYHNVVQVGILHLNGWGLHSNDSTGLDDWHDRPKALIYSGFSQNLVRY